MASRRFISTEAQSVGWQRAPGGSEILPTYVALPLLSAAGFLAAVVPPWLAVARSSLVVACGFAVLWVVLLGALLYDGRFELLPFAGALLALVAGAPVARGLAAPPGWSPALTQVVVIEAVMAVLAVVNLAPVWRERARRPGLPPRA